MLGKPGEQDATFIIARRDGGATRTVPRGELWVRPDRRSVDVRQEGGDGARSLKLLAVKPGAAIGNGVRAVRELVVEDPVTEQGILVRPDQIVGPQDLEVASPYVEVGLTHGAGPTARSWQRSCWCCR